MKYYVITFEEVENRNGFRYSRRTARVHNSKGHYDPNQINSLVTLHLETANLKEANKLAESLEEEDFY